MNDNRKVKMKILIFSEDSSVTASVMVFLAELQKTVDDELEPQVATCITEAEARLSQASMAIIDMSNNGERVAWEAMYALNIPVIVIMATKTTAIDIRDAERLRFLQKPHFPMVKFRRDMLDFIRLCGGGWAAFAA